MAAAGAAAAPSAVTYAVGFVLAAASGSALAVQAGVNATLARHSGAAFASFISFATGLAACAAFLGIDTTLLGAAPPRAPRLKEGPWWMWMGGPLGAVMVVSAALFAHRLGAGNFISVYVSVQILTAAVLDAAGLAGFPRRAFSWRRLLGIGLIAAGVVLVTLYPGDPVAKPPPPGAAPPAAAADAAAAAVAADAAAAGEAGARRLLGARRGEGAQPRGGPAVAAAAAATAAALADR
ncbi:hypothetical protein Rsub_03911 [Raphidocelis subcapitata]|uniref:EamA domain-containing protein n=1 Tax=Raphidocelis subcapitata TaxID=307507 RepID=A0A2V0P1U0_9CHLO|nr:hypothetical protein Rsub_03911 [Raphidocelis subcapitata]|eukprot:GBF91055.1 hypothetical protein Rsub_03911 [Raphidocelis subcapitata]